jgi:4-hydroxythreonine-4-phosphate dehydrogenase
LQETGADAPPYMIAETGLVKRIAITMGDRYGVGPELVARLVSRWPDTLRHPANEAFLPLVLGDPAVFERGCEIAGVAPDLRSFTDPAAACRSDAPAMLQLPFAAPLGSGRVSAEAGTEVLATLDCAAGLARRGAVDAIVYAPLNKQAMRDAGHAGGDEAHYFGRLFGVDNVGELNQLGDIWTSRVTSHVPLADVAALITEASVRLAIERMWRFLTGQGQARPTLAVAALNPHAGEGGAFGREEIDIIAPAVAAARAAGIEAVGPIPADTVFPQAMQAGYAGIVTMYHDQGQIALKLLGLGRGVTFLAGLPLPVATPGHGTAFDIAGKGLAIPDGLEAAVATCRRMLGG